MRKYSTCSAVGSSSLLTRSQSSGFMAFRPMAAKGHTATQWPQVMQRSAWSGITVGSALGSNISMMRGGHSWTQMPQRVHLASSTVNTLIVFSDQPPLSPNLGGKLKNWGTPPSPSGRKCPAPLLFTPSYAWQRCLCTRPTLDRCWPPIPGGSSG